jgi:hypothetical protein
MDMKYLHCAIRDAMENLVRITAERDCVNARALRRTARTFRPARDVCDDTPDAPLDDRCDGRIMNDQPVGNCIEVSERFLGCRRLSFTAEFCERGLNLRIGGEAAFLRRAQTAIDTGKFFRRGFVFAILESGVEFKREFGELVLDMGWPSLDALQNFGQFLCLHDR